MYIYITVYIYIYICIYTYVSLVSHDEYFQAYCTISNCSLVVERNDILDDPLAIDAASGVRIWEGGLDLARHLAKQAPTIAQAICKKQGAAI